MANRKKILFLTGSMNQTIQMHKISMYLSEYDCYFSQFFSDDQFISLAIKWGILNGTIMGRPLKRIAENYLLTQGLKIDDKAELHHYDLVVFCSDLLFPKKFKGVKTIWVQEGMIDPFTTWSGIIQKLKLPRYWTMGTSLNGTSNLCDIYCAASEGYKNYITEKGTNPDKVVVTGIPNYDHLKLFLDNDFPYSDYVMVATSDIRETFRFENRTKFLKKCVEIAGEKRLLFKLHPNENKSRAMEEIKRICPENTLIFTDGPTNDMIANCSELITQYSTVVYTGIALGKKVYSYFNIDELNQLMPIQNEGSSAENISTICREYIEFTGKRNQFIAQYSSSFEKCVKGYGE
ncbi:hypothetical protein G9H61_04560 [Aquirufa ecclesiirivi]|uniref:UDP-N-acetyl glucosamine 2-epimerase n=1 Tax=Aquirufa ecclesiirivi TaxID=2715124 RepID=A0ABT4JEQ5_9BACT|nr:hypothetical protein [Aquirufa ecclesiirivi]MCZ2474703.1 hypothetical protein [Aquirufa ecclesiirivi]